jgi:L-asparagine transporter-like permease
MTESTSASARTSATEDQPHDHHDVPRFEAWLAVLVSGIVPMVIALFVPRTYFAILATISALLFVIGLAMLVASERRARQRRQKI